MPDNLLIREKSPYLLQHAHNPVYWYPWGEDAFTKAMAEDKPVFLSIGYSTCHWCHVMAHESFEDEEVAALLNQHYVAVKVDREERPDIDSVYMSACQALTGSGGWPLTVLMGADQRPFFVGTYFPKHAKFGQTGLVDLLTSIARQWQSDRQRLLETGAQLTDLLSSTMDSKTSDEEPTKALLKNAVLLYIRMFDSKNGGFGSAPKFPTPHHLYFLMRFADLQKEEHALSMVTLTLNQMARGGLFDHVGGGFSRYSTDSRWLIPHFEKMLYDNALLSIAYSMAYARTKHPFYRQTLERTLEYVLKELTDEQGGFYCSQDADSDGVEGKYYVFTPQEITSVLGDADGPWFNRVYDIMELGNFEGKSIPNLLKYAAFENAYKESSELIDKLYDYRKGRTKLHRDDKILTSWNALMIVAFCHAAGVLESDRYLLAAKHAASFLETHLTREDGQLSLRWREGEAKNEGHLDDYAFYAWALLALYQGTYDVRYLMRACEISELMLDLFFDEENGGCYLYAIDSERLILRPKEVYDGAVPSGNSVAVLVFGRLYKLTGEDKWRQAYTKQSRFLSRELKSYPIGQSFTLYALTEALYPTRELICVTSDESAAPLLHSIQKEDFPNLNVLVKTPKNADALFAVAPFTREYPIPSQGTMYYLCQNGACNAPTDNALEVLRELEGTRAKK